MTYPHITYARENGTSDIFEIHQKIGKGTYGVVRKVLHLNTHKIYAMKIISTKKYNNEKGQIILEKMKNEIAIQKNLDHPNIVRFKLAFSDKSHQYIVLEYCPGNTILEYMLKRKAKHLSEPETRQILKDVINGLIYLHNRKIIHHDIKLENFIIGSDGKVKFSDFGLSSLMKDKHQKNYMVCGTTAYMSPEMLDEDGIKGHSFEVDIWAVGVSAFLMLTGRLPFEGPDQDTIEEKIKNCDYRFPQVNPISLEAKDFIEKIFQIDPKKRPALIDLLEHPFLTKIDKKKIRLYRLHKSHAVHKYCNPITQQSVQKLKFQ